MSKDGQIVSKVANQQFKGTNSRVVDTSDQPTTSSRLGSASGDMNLTCFENSSNELETLTSAVDSVLSQLVLSSYAFEADIQRRQFFENSSNNLIYSSPGAVSSRISASDYEPWVVAGGQGENDVREPVVGTEFVDSIVREKLEPLLHDFVNNNSVSSLSFTSSNNYDEQLTKYNNSRFNGPGIGFKTKLNVVETGSGFSSSAGVRTPDSDNNNGAASFASIQNCNLNGAVFSAGSSASKLMSKKQMQSNFWANNQLQLETPVGSVDEQRNFFCRKIVDCVNKLQHWAENCPYSQVRDSLTSFLRSLSEVSHAVIFYWLFQLSQKGRFLP